MTKNEKNKGITLVALIITIIVMLILVGITVNVALNGGLFETAQEAGKQTELETDRELLTGAVLGALSKDGVTVDFEKLDKNLPNGFTGKIGTYTSSNGNIFTVDSNGKISIEGESEQEDQIDPNYEESETSWSGPISTGLSGTGTQETPFIINSAADLAYLAKTVNEGQPYSGKNFILLNDIDSVGNNWIPIGNNSNAVFDGIFDGAGYCISDIEIDGKFNFRGLFGNVGENAIIRNLGVRNTSIKNGYKNNGAIAGYNKGKIEECWSNGGATLNGIENTGGIVGYNLGEILKSKVQDSKINSQKNAGLISGYNKGIEIDTTGEGIVNGEYVTVNN